MSSNLARGNNSCSEHIILMENSSNLSSCSSGYIESSTYFRNASKKALDEINHFSEQIAKILPTLDEQERVEREIVELENELRTLRNEELTVHDTLHSIEKINALRALEIERAVLMKNEDIQRVQRWRALNQPLPDDLRVYFTHFIESRLSNTFQTSQRIVNRRDVDVLCTKTYAQYLLRCDEILMSHAHSVEEDGGKYLLYLKNDLLQGMREYEKLLTTEHLTEENLALSLESINSTLSAVTSEYLTLRHNARLADKAARDEYNVNMLIKDKANETLLEARKNFKDDLMALEEIANTELETSASGLRKRLDEAQCKNEHVQAYDKKIQMKRVDELNFLDGALMKVEKRYENLEHQRRECIPLLAAAVSDLRHAVTTVEHNALGLSNLSL